MKQKEYDVVIVGGGPGDGHPKEGEKKEITK